MAGPLLHADADAFFASVALRGRPWLATRPVVVGEVVVACASYPARERGLRAGMGVPQARRVCPEVVVLPVPAAEVQQVGDALLALFEELVPAVEPGSVEEAFLDTSGSSWSAAEQVAGQVRRRARAELGIGVSVGVGRTRLVAKTASRWAKPDGLLVLTPSEESVLQGLPLRDLWGVGERTADRLAAVGVDTLAGLGRLTAPELHQLCGTTMARRLRAMAEGRDDAVVRPAGRRRTLSAETATAGWGRADRSPEELARVVVGRLAHRVLVSGRRAGTVTLQLRVRAGPPLLRRLRLPEPSQDADVLAAAVTQLLARAPVPELDSLAVTLGDLVDVGRAEQDALF